VRFDGKHDHADGQWVRSSRCVNGSCIEVRFDAEIGDTRGTTVTIRDGKNRSGPTLSVDHETWASFVKAIKADEF